MSTPKSPDPSEAAAPGIRGRSLRWLQLLLTLATWVAGLTVVGAVGFAIFYAVVDLDEGTVISTPPVPLVGVELEKGSSGLLPGVTVQSGKGVPLTLANPTTEQATLALLAWVPRAAVYFIFFGLLGRLVRAVRRGDPFTPATARQLRFLGWFLIDAALLAALAEMILLGVLGGAVTTQQVPLFDFDIPGYALISGIGILVIAEVVRRGAVMREALEGTI
ncbi:MAG: DUF2975 domain-containing protein [Pseudonocardiaceae bacterium]